MEEISLFYAISETGSWWVAAEYAADVAPLIFHYESLFGASKKSRLESIREISVIEFSVEDADSVTLDDWESPRSLRREFEEAKGMCEVGVISQGKR
jgi:hypothetical protein